MPQQRLEEQGLAPEQFPELNRQFFTEERGPHVFLRHRMRGVMLAATSNEIVRQALNEGVAVGTLKWSGSADALPAGEEELAQFAALEATVLFHHAAEALLRLLIALEGKPPCPWLEITRMRQPGVFPKAVRNLRGRLSADATKDLLAQVFYGRADRNDAAPGYDTERWDDQISGIATLVWECAHRLSAESALYNSAKHGLSTVQGRAATSFGPHGESPILKTADHPSITILEVAKRNDGRPEWRQTTHWIAADKNLALVHLISVQIENLWTLARHRYVEGAGQVHILPMSGTVLEKALAGNDEPDEHGVRITVPSMSMNLLYRVDADEQARKAHPQASKNKKRGRR